jgi:predicted nucleotidyltransferase
MCASCGLHDLPGLYLEKIQDVLVQYPQVEEAVLFGSWAKGSARPGSDIDIALKGSGINLQVLNSISRNVDDLLIPNAVDLCIYDRIDDPDFLEHINRVGKVLYLRDGNVESI